MALSIQRVHRHGRAHHHHQHRARRLLWRGTRQHMVTRADQGHEAVRTQAARMVVAIRDAAGMAGGHNPARLHVPQFQLLFDAAAHGVARHIAAEHAARRLQAAPLAFGQLVDVLKKNRAMGKQGGTRLGRGKLRPFETGIANINGQKSHGVGQGIQIARKGNSRPDSGFLKRRFMCEAVAYRTNSLNWCCR
jgi:hypothetical protein